MWLYKLRISLDVKVAEKEPYGALCPSETLCSAGGYRRSTLTRGEPKTELPSDS